MMRRARTACVSTAAVLVLAGGLTAGCEGGTLASPGEGAVGPDAQAAPAGARCPRDPDCAIGGDCSLYECPDHWDCTRTGAAVRCTSPGPDYPDDAGGWECADEAGETVCRRRGDYPDGGGGDSWTCERTGDLVECRKSSPDYPDGGGGTEWTCWFELEERVCESDGPDFPDDGGGDGPDDGGDTPDDGGGSCPDEWPDELSCTDTCPSHVRTRATFVDDLDGEDDGQLVAFGNGSRDSACGSLYVDVTGYYALYDLEMAESCDHQRDETGYLTVENSCNRDGNPLESNVDDMLVVADPDNTPTCSPGGCGAGRFCLDTGTRFGTCCVPDRPAFMGTFLLVAGERNTVCVHHWCPEWRRRGRRDGYVNAGCDSSIDSIHLRFDEAAILCPDDSPIAGGCR